VARRRAQIKEFLAAWRAALKGARQAEGNKATRRPMPMAPAASTGPDPAAPRRAPATPADPAAPRVAPLRSGSRASAIEPEELTRS